MSFLQKSTKIVLIFEASFTLICQQKKKSNGIFCVAVIILPVKQATHIAHVFLYLFFFCELMQPPTCEIVER